jgi:minor extracellular protease Epr
VKKRISLLLVIMMLLAIPSSVFSNPNMSNGRQFNPPGLEKKVEVIEDEPSAPVVDEPEVLLENPKRVEPAVEEKEEATHEDKETVTPKAPVVPAEAPVAPVVREQETVNPEMVRVIVAFRGKADKRVIENAGGKVIHEFNHFNGVAITVPATALRGLQKNPNVLYVERDAEVLAVSQTIDWGVKRVEPFDYWSQGYTGQGVRVAVLDTGIAQHEDLKIAGGASMMSYTTSFHDDNGHGTHVAGSIAALHNDYGTAGVSPTASMYAVKVLDENGSGYLSDVVKGLDWAITNKMHIVNMSLGTTSNSSTLESMVNKVYNHGILMVAAAGNNGNSDGTGDTVLYPARYSAVIAVAATDSSDRRASFSATGPDVEIAAPGVSILSTLPGNRYGRASGTSMAAPHVAGVLAIMMNAYPDLTPAKLRTLMQKSAIDLGAEGRDNHFGFGLLQAPPLLEEVPAEEQPVEEPAEETDEETDLEEPTKEKPNNGNRGGNSKEELEENTGNNGRGKKLGISALQERAVFTRVSEWVQSVFSFLFR